MTDPAAKMLRAIKIRARRAAGCVGFIERRQQRAPHTRLPEAADMVGDAGEGFFPVRHRIEKVADPVRHIDQILIVHGSPHLPDEALANSRCLSKSSCSVLKRE